MDYAHFLRMHCKQLYSKQLLYSAQIERKDGAKLMGESGLLKSAGLLFEQQVNTAVMLEEKDIAFLFAYMGA